MANWLQRFKPKSAFARGVGVLVGGTAGAQALMVLAAPLLTRLYSPEDFGLLAVFGRDRAAPRASVGQWLGAYLGEVLAFAQVFSWRQPFRAGHEPDYLPVEPHGPGAGSDARSSGSTAVLLLHGYCCNRGLWAPWLRQLRARGVPCRALTMEPVFGRIEDWVPAIDAARTRELVGYRWPGNVRELRNVIERALIMLGDGPQVDGPHLGTLEATPPSAQAVARADSGPPAAPSHEALVLHGEPTLEGIEREYLASLLKKYGGNRRRVAEALGVSERTAYRMMDRYGYK